MWGWLHRWRCRQRVRDLAELRDGIFQLLDPAAPRVQRQIAAINNAIREAERGNLQCGIRPDDPPAT
jgi:hypothetical protein